MCLEMRLRGCKHETRSEKNLIKNLDLGDYRKMIDK